MAWELVKHFEYVYGKGSAVEYVRERLTQIQRDQGYNGRMHIKREQWGTDIDGNGVDRYSNRGEALYVLYLKGRDAGLTVVEREPQMALRYCPCCGTKVPVDRIK